MWSKKELFSQTGNSCRMAKRKTTEANARGLSLLAYLEELIPQWWRFVSKAFADSSVGVIMPAASDPADRRCFIGS